MRWPWSGTPRGLWAPRRSSGTAGDERELEGNSACVERGAAVSLNSPWPLLVSLLAFLTIGSVLVGAGQEPLSPLPTPSFAPSYATPSARLCRDGLQFRPGLMSSSTLPAHAESQDMTQAWPLLFWDDFGSPASGWPVGDWECATAAYQGGEYVVYEHCSGGTTLIHSQHVTDFEFSLEARWAVDQRDVSYALVFSRQDAVNFYWFEVAPNGQTFSVWRVRNDSWSKLIDWTSSGQINRGTAKNVLRVVGTGSDFQLYINGQQVRSFTDSTLSYGSTGMAVYNYNASGTYGCAFDKNGLWGIVYNPSVQPTPTRTLTPTRTGQVTATRTPTRTRTPVGMRVRAYLPTLLRRELTSPVVNGSFETGDLRGWQQGGELPRSVTQAQACGGQRSVLLGNPGWGDGSSGNIPSGSGWIEQSVYVPNTPSVQLWFCHRVLSYDVILGDTGLLWDSLEVTVNANVAVRAGRTTTTGHGTLYDGQWQQERVSLAAYRGQTVRLRFAVWNREYDGNGRDYYNTWAYVDHVMIVR